MATHQLEPCPRCCRSPAWLSALAAPWRASSHPGEHWWARNQGNNRVTQLSPSFLFLNCPLPARRLPCPQPRQGLSPAQGWGSRSREPSSTAQPCAGRCSEAVGWGTGRGEPQHPHPHPPASCGTNCRRGTPGCMGAQIKTHRDTQVTCIHRHSDTPTTTHRHTGMCMVPWARGGTWGHVGSRGMLVTV